jgi:hypothetical protein
MVPRDAAQRHTFPRSANLLLPALVVLMGVGPLYVVALIGYGAGPRTTTVGYQPAQPMPLSHEMHVGQLGMDCRYCHNTVEKAAFAALPPTQTCWNCHNAVSGIRRDSPRLLPLMESHATGMPVEWVKVHNLADYVYINHSRHVTAGVGCVECHGRIDKMDADPITRRGVRQVHTLSMAWCLDCHRDPDARLRPPEEATNMTWGAGLTDRERRQLGRQLRELKNINPSTDCWTCHR